MTHTKHNVVTMGGANGPSLVLRGLKQYDELNLTAVIAMTDSGRSSAKVRDELGQLPPADILRVMIALSPYDYQTLMQLLYRARFASPSLLDGLNIGTAFIALAAKHTGNLPLIISELSKMLECRGTVLPVTLDMAHLVVECSDNTCLVGEGNIDEPLEHIDREISRASLKPAAYITGEAAEAIRQADALIIGPGDLYTSCIASILPVGTLDAIRESRAKIIFVAGNKYSIGGEPAPRTLSERTQALERYLPRPVDAVVYDSHRLSDEEAEYYRTKGWGLIEFDVANMKEKMVVGEDVEITGGGIDPDKLGRVLRHVMMSTNHIARNP